MVKILLIVLTLIFWGVAEAEQRVVAVQSIMIKPYEEALRGFKSVCDATVKETVVSELEGIDVVKELRRARPDMILAVGMGALSKVKKIKDIPIVYLMVPNPQSIISDGENMTGVSMNIPPEKQLFELQNVLPYVKRVGLLYDPVRTGHFVNKARVAARAKGIELVTEEVHRSKDVPSLVNAMRGRIDAFWMLPDTIVVTPETVEFLLLFSLENKIPLFTFSAKYVERGALMSLDVDAFDSGRQAGEMANKVLSGTDVEKVLRTDARKAVLSINLKTAEKLGITISDEIIKKARIVLK